MRSVAALLLVGLACTSPLPGQDALAQAERLLSKKDYRGAEALLRDLVQAEPSNARAHGNLALALLPQGKVREAVDEGRLAAAFEPQSAEARYIYGLALRAAGRSLDAAREFERAASLKPGELAPAEAAAAAYASAGDKRAAAAYEKLIGLEPDRPALRAEFAEYLWSVGELDRGNAVATSALEKFPGSADLHSRYGRALFEQERFLDSSRELERARELGARDTPTLALLGNALRQAGRIDAAQEALEAAVREHPADAALRQDLGRLLLSVGQGDSALRHLQEAARMKPGEAAAHLDLGRAYEAVGRLSEAGTAYREAVRLGPQLAEPRYALGRLLLREGKRAEAEQELALYRTSYDRAVRLVEESGARGAEIALAWAEYHQGNASAALSRFQSLPETADTLLGRATALSRLNRHREAVALLERARLLDPQNRKIEARLTAELSRAEKP